MIKEIRIDDEEHKIPREIVIKVCKHLISFHEFDMHIFQATIDKLLDKLLDANQLIDDPNFVDDFLLTYRAYISDPVIITNKILETFTKTSDNDLCEHLARVILSWINNHYHDFESNAQLNEFLEKFDDYLQHHQQFEVIHNSRMFFFCSTE